ncbi:hypothetical protein [Halobacterium noricense]|uniref:hypothetical protein n=1 Tax=Halobacterium noricense TaxID=223182 RepID=UPI001E59F6A5|nr:hypothetical protein [Halobacterium noricense]UHH25226.1 hypothetical protein LT974_14760 [Halobacterium noricense]
MLASEDVLRALEGPLDFLAGVAAGQPAQPHRSVDTAGEPGVPRPRDREASEHAPDQAC